MTKGVMVLVFFHLILPIRKLNFSRKGIVFDRPGIASVSACQRAIHVVQCDIVSLL